MRVLETPDDRFADLPDFPWRPRYVEVGRDLRMAAIDEGPRDAPVILYLHGEPSWSFLYRSMIPPALAAGFRVVAPDLIGFGRSSKPAAREDYTYAAHSAWLERFVELCELERITLFCQDWGSLLGLRLAAEQAPRFRAIVIGNGFLPAGNLGTGSSARRANTAAFLAWRTFARFTPVFPTSRIVQAGVARRLSDAERRAYDAPYPGAAWQAGARAFPGLVPISPGDPAVPRNEAAWRVLESWEKPFVTTFSTGDPITRGLDRQLQARVPGARGRAHVRVRGGHFLQEDAGVELAAVVVDTARSAG